MTGTTITKAALVAVALLLGVGAPALGQPAGGPAPYALPAGCPAPSAGMAMPAPPMPMPMAASMTDAQKGLHEAMMRMEPAMMAGTMASDPDVAWACSMIPHHVGALEMSRVALRTGKDPEIRRMAEKTISDQEKDIAEITAWVGKRAKK